jgi:hypothetical protein
MARLHHQRDTFSLLEAFWTTLECSQKVETPELAGESEQHPLSDAKDEELVPSSIVSNSTSH